MEIFHSANGSFLFDAKTLAKCRTDIDCHVGLTTFGQVVVHTQRPDSKNTASEWTSKENPTQLVVARVLAWVAEWNSNLLQRYCRGKLRILEGQQTLLLQICSMTHSKLMGCKLRVSASQLLGTTMQWSSYKTDWSRGDVEQGVRSKKLQNKEVNLKLLWFCSILI